jgi:CTP:molybdopterin cytidylyltransferase MocA
LLVDRSLFDELRAARPAEGAKPVIRAHASPAGDIAIADEGAFTDIDTAQDYLRTISDRLSGGAGNPRQSREQA